MLTPIEFGLPAKFSEWRKGQLEAVDQALLSKERFVTLCAPTGFGKSLAYMAAGLMGGKRTVICTSTKGLQDQLRNDFHSISSDVRGQSNYLCNAASSFGLDPLTTVEMGPCHGGEECNLKSGGCDYFDRYREAQRAEIVVTNYALWMVDRHRERNRDGSSLNSLKPVEMLVLDEAHDAPEAVAGHVGGEMKYDVINRCGSARVVWPGLKDEDQEGWQAWAIETEGALEGMVEEGMKTVAKTKDRKLARRVQTWKRAQREVGKVAEMKGEWVIETQNDWRTKRYGPIVRFDPLWPAQYAEQVLFRGVKKVVLVSATVRPKTAQLLGIASETNNFLEYISTFPVASRPVIHVPTVQMSHRMTEWNQLQWVQMIDRLLDARGDRKGIIHTVSYERSKLIFLNSRHSSRMLLHDSQTRSQTVEQFKSSSSNSVFVSPSVDTGYDFPLSQCEFQIISKVPFVNNSGKLMKRRLASDKQYSNYLTALTIVQMTGRGMRSRDDRCETLIVDDQWAWFYPQNRQHFPKWFQDSVRAVGRGQTPVPPEKLK